jgi:outer membrane receptor for ferrienterochelin and colicins
MGLSVRAVLAVLLFSLSHAQADEPPPRVNLVDLPPVPRVEAGDQSSIAIVAASLASEDVVVGAAKREQSLGNVASAVTVISGDRIRRFGYRTVSEALRGVAGLYVVDDRMSQRLGIRGLQILGDFNNRILVLIDGATVNEPWGAFVGIGRDLPVSIDDIERIEVVRGPVSSVYGTNAFFGIINIVTKGADRSPRVYGRVEGGTINTVAGNAGFSVGGVNRQLRGTVAYAKRLGETVDIGNFETDADGEEALMASLVGAYDGAFAQVRAYQKTRELAGAPYDIVPGDSRNRNVDSHILAEGGYSRDLGERVTAQARAYFNAYRFSDFLVYEPDDDEAFDSNFRDYGNATWFGAELRTRLAILGKDRLGLTAGAEATFIDVSSQSYAVGDALEDRVDIPTTFNTQGIYAELDARPVSWLSLSGGIRFDHHSLFAENVSPRAALLLYKGDDYGAKFLFAEGFRSPGPYEAFFADGRTFIDNPDLSPEKIRSYEGVLWAKPLPGLNLRLSGFRWALRDIIESTSVGEFLQFSNISRLTSTGGEIEATYRDTRGWYAYLSLTASYVERDGDPDLAVNSPLLDVAGGLSTPLLFGLAHLSTEVKVLGAKRTRDPELDADPHVGWNAVLYFPRLKGFDLTLGVRNILGQREDVVTQDDYDREDDGPIYLLPGEGREIYARLGFSY